MASFGKSIGQSAKQGGANALDKGIDAVSSAPKAAYNLGQLMKHGIDPSMPLPREGEGLIRNNGAYRNTGKGSQRITEGERLMQSKNITERVNSMGELYRGKRAQGGEYSGLDGRFKALKSSIGEFHAANKKAAPGITEEDKLRKTAQRLIRMGDKK
jgi:hypothetical protein